MDSKLLKQYGYAKDDTKLKTVTVTFRLRKRDAIALLKTRPRVDMSLGETARWAVLERISETRQANES